MRAPKRLSFWRVRPRRFCLCPMRREMVGSMILFIDGTFWGDRLTGDVEMDYQGERVSESRFELMRSAN